MIVRLQSSQAREDGGTNADGDKGKGKDKDEDKWCHRCCTKGHNKEDCNVTIFCDVCESKDHVAAKCPIKKKPRPVAHAVGYAVDEFGFYHIPHALYSTSKESGNAALVKVFGGHLSEKDLVITNLRSLVPAPSSFECDIQLHAPDTWVVPFPSKAELRRTINFGSADLKDGLSLKFEEFEVEEYYGNELPLIWMRVTNLPKVLCGYEVFHWHYVWCYTEGRYDHHEEEYLWEV